MDNYTQTLLSQYANSPTITALIESFNDAIDPTVDLEAFYSNVWDVSTAVGAGLDVWGAIVGISRTVQVPYTFQPSNFGFAEALAGATDTPQPFGQAPFYSRLASYSVTMDDDQYRTVILTKAITNLGNGSAKSINQALRFWFSGRSEVHIIDNLNMSVTAYFTFTPTEVEIALLNVGSILQIPAGVIQYIVLD